MLYNLLFQYSDRFPLFNVLRYPSFRMLMAGLVSLMIGLFLGPSYIDALRKLHANYEVLIKEAGLFKSEKR